jgi:hypothetical protein
MLRMNGKDHVPGDIEFKSALLIAIIRVFPQLRQTIAGTGLDRFLPFKIHYSLIILSFDTAQCELLTASLNKTQIN